MQLLHTGGLVLGQHLRDHLIHAHLTGDGVGGLGIVAGQQHHPAAGALQSGDGRRAVRLHSVGHCQHAQRPALLGEVQHRLAVVGPRLRLVRKRYNIHPILVHKVPVSGKYFLPMQHRVNTAAGNGGEVLYVA